MRKNVFVAAAAAGLLAGCGGGGGGGEEAAAPPPVTAARVTLTGLAAKGLMANADVTVLPVNANGSIGTTVLASTTTNASGTYSLQFDATAGAPYVIRIAAKADGSTTHLDEIRGSQPLPAGFALRALTVPATSGNITTSVTVTPFSEMATAAASRAAGGITAANTAQAQSTVAQLLGFNPTAVTTAPSTAATASADAQKLAILLTAVSKLAADGGLGCATATPGQQTQCVTEKLAAAASTTSLTLQTGSTNVSAALASAITTVLATPSLAGAVPSSSLTVTQANLGCTGTACTAAPATSGTPPGPTATALAIASAKQLFTEIRSDFATLFSRGGATALATGAANLEAKKFGDALQGMQVPVDVMAKDLGVLLTAADLYNDFMNDRTQDVQRGGAPGEFSGTSSPVVANLDAVACALYADTTNTVLATSKAQVVQIGCRALYHVTFDATTGVRREWRHGFSITPAGGGRFDYTTRARLRTVPCNAPACTDFNQALQTNGYSGTLNTTVNSAGSITNFSVDGRLPGAFVTDTTPIYNEYHAIQMQGVRTISGFRQEVAAVNGSLRAFAAGDVLLGTLTLRDGSNVVEFPVTREGSLPSAGNPPSGGTISGGRLNLVWRTPAVEFEGVLALTDSVWDSSGTSFSPQRAELSGSLRNITAGVAPDFLRGSFIVTRSGYGAHNATLPISSTNRYTESFSFAAAVTAPNRPLLEYTAGATKTSDRLDFSSLTVQYRSLVNGTPRIVVGATVTVDANGNDVYDLTEATANLRLSWRENAATSDLFQGTTRIGTLTISTGLLTFVDGSFISLDAGL